ncbi:MAG: hypothetical protein FJ308_03035 [Planctomycetes bacterium]|nr:hypothetical protein [Planctomycetota bacterium]
MFPQRAIMSLRVSIPQFRRPIHVAILVTIAILCTGSIGLTQDESSAEPAQDQTSEPTQKSDALTQTVPTEKLIDFVRDIAPLLESRCESCHEGDSPKGGFDVGDRDSFLGYITPGSVADSTLWTDYLMAKPATIEKHSLIMPPDGPLPKAELTLLKLWIEEGAVWPEGTQLKSVPIVEDDNVSKTSVRRGYRAIGYFHPVVVHFPIALITVAAASVLLSYLLGQRFSSFGYACLVIGSLFAIVSAVMGWSFAEIRGFASWDTMLAANATEQQSNEFFHRWLGSATAIAGLIVCYLGSRAKQSDGSRPGHAWRIGTIVLALLVGAVGHQGGELVYGDIFAKAIEQFSK